MNELDKEREIERLNAIVADLYEACKRSFNWINVILDEGVLEQPENQESLRRLVSYIEQALAKATAK